MHMLYHLNVQLSLDSDNKTPVFGFTTKKFEWEFIIIFTVRPLLVCY